jgi:drug/metabolite transporter (DMT)-like permease
VKGTRRAYLAWVVVCLVWGTTYLAIRISLETIPALLMGGFRWVAAGVLLVGILAARGERMPPLRTWPALSGLGILLIGFGNGGVVWAEQTVPSGLAAVLAATTPFWLVGVDAVMPNGEALSRRRSVGLVVGFLGNVLLVWPEVRAAGGRAFLGGVVATQIAALGWAIGSGYARRRGVHENVVAAAALEMLSGGIVMLVLGLILHEWQDLTFNVRTMSALLYLILFGAIAGFSAFVYALKHLPLATVSLYSYINPVIAVALGALVLKEPVGARTVIAGAIVLAGVAIVRK